jgi:hypothetical protein
VDTKGLSGTGAGADAKVDAAKADSKIDSAESGGDTIEDVKEKAEETAEKAEGDEDEEASLASASFQTEGELEVHAGDTVQLVAEAESMPDGTSIKFILYLEGDTPDNAIATMSGTLTDNRVEVDWRVQANPGAIVLFDAKTETAEITSENAIEVVDATITETEPAEEPKKEVAELEEDLDEIDGSWASNSDDAEEADEFGEADEFDEPDEPGGSKQES